MKFQKLYKDTLGCGNSEGVFQYIISNLKPSTLIWSYFVNWDKVFKTVKDIEINLNILNYLIGKKDDFDAELKGLIKKHPQIISAIPVLLVRDGKSSKEYKILVDYKKKKFVYEDFNFKDFKNLKAEDIDKIVMFVEKTGIKRLFTEQKIKNVVDYVIGVEAGIDSNARKNRGGHAMEEITEHFIKDLCDKNGFKYLKEANAKKIKEVFGKNVPVDKSSRRYDYVIDNGKTLYIIETNYYSGGGSKLKSTAGEYRNLYDTLKETKFKFIWITDGSGWMTTQKPLKETFEHNDYLMSLAMVEKGILEEVIKGNL
jgi:type II restriction enzyme